MSPPESGVKVRMYNPGFGDCFLLAFRKDNGEPYYMLIDCGVHHQYSGGSARIKKVAENILAATNQHIDTVVITHEHTDHLYGFKYARDIFENIEIDNLWLSWAENPDDQAAKKIKDEFGIKIKALQATIQVLDKVDKSFSNLLQDVLDFELVEELAATGGKAEQLLYLKDKVKNKLVRPEDYLNPGEEISLPFLSDYKFYILGPPKNLTRLKELETESELYFKSSRLNEQIAFASAAIAFSTNKKLKTENKDLFDLSCPFDDSHKISISEAETLDFFKEYNKKALKWRQIDIDWLYSAEELALDINNYTNNTSLVIAIELLNTVPTKTILFPGDAQTGNWLSWHDMSWENDDCEEKQLKAKDLLEKCVLYKVGHHGSHNATLKEKGLELMTSSDLVAMIPVDEMWAKADGREWEHPDPKILKRLEEKTKGRIFRSDQIPKTDQKPPKPDAFTDEDWEGILKNIKWDPSGKQLWIEYTVLGKPLGTNSPGQ